MPSIYQTVPFDFDKGFYGWRNEAQSGSCPEYWMPWGIYRAFIHPAPTTTYGVEWFYLRGEPRLTDDAQYLDLGDEEVLRIVDYAAWVLAFKQGLKEAIENPNPFKELFLLAAVSRNARLKSSALYRKFLGEHRDEQAPLREASPQPGVRA
jgi:hypothetical protein